MAEIDPVILELIAKDGEYRARLQGTAKIASGALAQQERGVQRLEAQMQKSSGAIGASFKRLAATMATAFTGRELAGMIDSFTRLQNNLRVTGLEGQKLADVQSNLLDISTRYGTSVEGLTGVFMKAQMAQQSLGASTSDIIRLTEVVSASLKVTGTSAAQAQGALLQLGQALGSGVVRAEEFNSILEGAYPLAQAAARGIEGYAGDVAKLRSAIADGKVTSQQFFEGVLKGGVQTLKDAENATLTLSGAFEALTSRLTVYVGESAKANGVTAALAGGIKMLADNINTIIPAFAVIVGLIGVRYVAGLAAATAGSIALTASKVRENAVLQASSAILAQNTGMLNVNAAAAQRAAAASIGIGVAARGAGAALLSAFGGPVGVAVAALVLGLGYLWSQTKLNVDAAKAAEIQSRKTESALDAEAKATEALANAKKAEREQVVASMKASRARAQQALQTAQALRAEALASLSVAKAQAASERRRLEDQATFGGSFGATELGAQNMIGTKTSRGVDKAQRALDRADKNIAELEGVVEGISKALDAAAAPVKLPDISSSSKGKKGGPSGPSADEINDRFLSELASIGQQTLSARQQLALSADERADLELRAVELARAEALRTLAADKDYSAAQKARVKDALENLAEFERERIERERRVQLFEESNDLAEARQRVEQDSLRDQFDLARTDDQRRAIALRILDAEDAYLRSKLEAVIANQDLTDAVRQQAQIELDALNSSAADRRAVVEKANQGALGRYIDDITDTKARVEEATVRQLQAVNDGITDALSKQLGIKNQFVKDMFSIFLDEVIFRPLAESLRDSRGAGGGIGGFLGAIVGSIFGRASGGRVNAGQIYRVNEGAGLGRAEYFKPAVSGDVIPLGQVNQRAAQSSRTTVMQPIINVDARGAVMNDQFARQILAQANQNAVSMTAQAANGILKAMPGKMASYQRDGTL